MKGWLIITFFYCVAVVALSAIIALREQPQTIWIATKELGPGHSLVKGDLFWSEGDNLWGTWPVSREEWEGKYLQKAIKPGEVIDTSRLLDKQVGVVWLASRDMKRNHRLTKRDLLLPVGTTSTPDTDPWEGRYLTEPVVNGQNVSPDKISLEPLIEVRMKHFLAWIKLKDFPAANRALNAGAVIELCSQLASSCVRGEVETISCDQKQPSACYAALWIEDQRQADFLKLGHKEDTVILYKSETRKTKETNP